MGLKNITQIYKAITFKLLPKFILCLPQAQELKIANLIYYRVQVLTKNDGFEFCMFRLNRIFNAFFPFISILQERRKTKESIEMDNIKFIFIILNKRI